LNTPCSTGPLDSRSFGTPLKLKRLTFTRWVIIYFFC
jgi:hypothetical protein